MDKRLLEILVCPMCKGPLKMQRAGTGGAQEYDELICEHDRLGFPIRDDIPVMLCDEARRLDAADDKR